MSGDPELIFLKLDPKSTIIKIIRLFGMTKGEIRQDLGYNNNMPQKLLLTSSGICEEIRNDFLRLIKDKNPAELKVAYIITAAYGDNGPNQEHINNHIKNFKKCGLNNVGILDLRGMKQLYLEKILQNKDIIFVGGGNTFYLLQQVKKSGFDKIVRRLLKAGKIYVGVSAGSYIACPTIEQAAWKHQDNNKCKLKDLTALNLVPFLLIAHFEEEHRDVIVNAAKTAKYPIVALNDKQAILVKNNKYKLIGKRDKVFLNGFQEKMW